MTTLMTPSSNSLIKNIGRSIVYFWRLTPGFIAMHVILMILQVTSSLSGIYFFGKLIGELSRVAGSGDAGRVYQYLAITGLTVLLERFSWKWLELNRRKSWTKWYSHIVVDYNRAVSSLDMATHHDVAFTKMLGKLMSEYQYTPSNFADTILNGVHGTLRLVASLAAVLSFAPILVPIMILSLIPAFLTEVRLSRSHWGLWSERGDSQHLAYRTTEYLLDKKKLNETKIFGTQPYLLSVLQKLYGGFFGQQLKNYQKIQNATLFSLLVEAITIVGAQAWLLTKTIAGTISLGNFTFYSGVITQFSGSLSIVANSLAYLNDQNVFMKDFYRLLDMKPSVVSPPNAKVLSKEVVPAIKFENVWFKYPSSNEWVLQDISLDINPHDRIAFVGENGAGKSTIVNLLLRFYDPQEGRITVNGIDIRELNLSSYYHHIGVLFQNFNDYPFSVRDNIALGRIEEFDDQSKIIDAATMSGANKFIDKYPFKYDQQLELGFKDGIEPSGGQWQRIALARALFRNADILVLDEPTAAVDAKSEYAIFKTLAEHSHDKTTIIISHRFSTVRNADKIYVIENGTIVEEGSHVSLMKHKSGLYKEMFDKQAEGYR